MENRKCPKHETGGGPCYCEGSIYHKKLNERPRCFNRPGFYEFIDVQVGWIYKWDIELHSNVRIPAMKRIPNPMSKECQQWKEFGEARRLNWNCDGCRHKPEDVDGAN